MKSSAPTRSGFTLVEALVAVAVLAVSLTPVFAQVNASFRLARTIQENLTASMLAQEGIELVRGMRDDNWFSGRDFDDGLGGCEGGCRIDAIPGSVLEFGADVPLKRNTETGFFSYETGGQPEETQYQRTIVITELAPGQLEVVSRVDWQSGRNTRQLEVTGYLFDWLAF